MTATSVSGPAALDQAPGAQTTADVWEDDSRRKTADGEALGLQLLDRLEVAKADIPALRANAPFKRALTRWGVEFDAIRWYDTEIPKQQWRLTASRWLSLGLGLATIGGTTALAMLQKVIGVSQFGLLVAGIFGVMQLFAAGGDPKARLGAFRKARADLKESMFTFEQTWVGHVVERNAAGVPQPTADFMTALYQEIRTARKIARDERDAFFATFKSPTEILGAATSTLDALRGRRADLTAAVKDAATPETSREAAIATRIQDLRNKLADATAAKEALEDKKKRLVAAKVPQAQLDDLQAKIEDAETDRFRTQRLLDLAVKSDVAHAS
jgi:hypothetical protein